MKDSQKLLTSLHPQPQTLKPSLNPKLAYTGVRVQGLGVSSTTEVCGFRVFVLYSIGVYRSVSAESPPDTPT